MATRPAIERRTAAGESGERFIDSRVRLRRLALLFAGVLLAIFSRLAWLDWAQGPQFREIAAKPLERRHWLDGVRGRILSRDGIVLAEDRPVLSVAVDYRWLADPPNAAWLRRAARQRLARQRLSQQARKDPARIAAEIKALRAEREALHRRLMAVCGLTPQQWYARTVAIQKQVSELANRVNARRQEKFAAEVRRTESAPTSPSGSWYRFQSVAGRILFPADVAIPPARIVIAEEIQDHIVVEGVSLDVVAQIEAHPDQFPGTRIVQQSNRSYPRGPRAAHLVGHLGAVGSEEIARARGASPHRYVRETDRVGRMGVERQYDLALRGEPGMELEATDLSGKVLSKRTERAPTSGRDLVLTLDASLQASAEGLLDAALARNEPASPGAAGLPRGGGAIVALDVRSGAILALASAPRFDPGAFQEDGADASSYLTDPTAPLVDRAIKMALPPGSVFKVVSAIALLEQGVVQPDDAFECQGYLRDPEHERCAIFTRHGEGHGQLVLEGALVQSCNVYFFHHADKLGATGLVEWGRRCGFGHRTGIDLPDEATGNLPALQPAGAQTAQRDGAAEVRAAAIGQGTVTATPLQVARLMSAIANGGNLVTPHVVSGWGLNADPSTEDRLKVERDPVPGVETPRQIPEMHTATLDVIRRALVRVVADPIGSAHHSVYLEGLAIAGKTGTAEVGGDQPDHAWFAGYAPAESPRVAFAVALEHGGGGGEAAGPVARRLVQRLAQLGYLGRGQVIRATHQVPVR